MKIRIRELLPMPALTATLSLMLAVRLTAQTFTTLHSFLVSGGANPVCSLILSGNTLYGTAGGGNWQNVTVFKVNTDGTGFTNLAYTEGFSSAGLLLSGNTLYGTTFQGWGFGMVFKVNTDGTGFTNLYCFTGGSDGANPDCSLVLSGNTLYGTASGGGSAGNGTVFSVNTDGTGFTNLSESPGDPRAGLVLSGNTLYGTGSGGGVYGTVFKVNTDGTGFRNLYEFTGGSDGADPEASLILSGNTLYGTASGGDSAGNGTVFQDNTNGTGFSTLHEFTGGSDGANPSCSLILSGNTLYGTASGGGRAGNGTVFAVNTGTAFRTLYAFKESDSFGNNNDGAGPAGGLILSGNILYGTAEYGGCSGFGTVFKVSTDGTGFASLHDFTGDGALQLASLISSGNTLYGTAQACGSRGCGAVFRMNADGTAFTNLYEFTGGADGAGPEAGLTLSGSTLYGTAHLGGSAGNGTVFKVNTDGTGFANLYEFTGGSDGRFPEASLIFSGNILYGTMSSGGSAGNGAVFAVKTDGTGFTNLHSFTVATEDFSNSWGYETNNDGIAPASGLLLSGNTLYGTASGGGTNGSGTVFAVNTDGTGFTNLHNFSAGDTNLSGFYTNSDGAEPVANLILSGNTLYGTASGGGSAGTGTVFKVNTNGTGFTTLYSFTKVAQSFSTGIGISTNSDGYTPGASLILSGNTLYGTTIFGGTNGYGTVFQVNTNGTGFKNLYNFSNGTDGANPASSLILSGNTLYGTVGVGFIADGPGWLHGEVFSLSLTEPPQLKIIESGANVILTWPTNAAGFTLRSATNLISPAVWSAVSPAAVVVNGQYAVTNPVSGTQVFYQLSQ
jgi:uncharacterized repeat protein (TIGR03803 family)